MLGDGDYLMGCTAFWTAARYGIPLLAVIANNRSFFNDEVHQERVAQMRGRNPANKWIGQHIGGPDVDLAAMARAQGCAGWGPVHDAAGLRRPWRRRSRRSAPDSRQSSTFVSHKATAQR